MTSGADVERPRDTTAGAPRFSLDYHRDTVPVASGELCVGVWEPSVSTLAQRRNKTSDPPTVIALHGITGNHLCWAFVASAAPYARVIAPDLRGRGGSCETPGPFGLASHADDLIDILDHYGVERATVLGHSMGAFVGLLAADRHLERISSLVLVDGGLPMDPPPPIMAPGFPDPVVSRLTLTFPDEAAALRFWRHHPALVGQYTKELEEYALHDLGGVPGAYQSRSTPESVLADAADIRQGEHIIQALDRLAVPAQWLIAPRGLLDEAPGLYPPATVVQWRERFPQIEVQPTQRLNHYTMLFSDRGAHVVANALHRAVTGQVRTPARRDVNVVLDPSRGRVGLERAAQGG